MPLLGENRSGRVAAHDADRGVLLLEIVPHTGHRPASAGRRDEMRDAAARLLPQLGTGRRLVGGGVGLVVELVGEHGVRRLVGDPLRHHDVVVRMVGRHGGRGHNHLGAERLEQTDFLLRHLVGHREDALVAFDRGGDGQADARVAARALDNGAARLEAALALEALDDRNADPILDRPARIENLGLGEHRGPDPAREAVEPDERRPADGVENGVVRGPVALDARHGLARDGGGLNCTGSLMDTAIARPWRRAGENVNALAPARAAVSRAG